MWTAAAAVIFLALVAGWYLWPVKQPVSNAVETVAGKEIPAPVSNSAVITLADGSKIYLDSIAQGKALKQGNITITGEGEGDIQYMGQDQQVSINTISVPRGSKPVSLGLADGTRVWVDAGSSLQFPTAFPGKEREVTVTGQVYLDVKGDPEKPFFVRNTIEGTRVEVLGTAFNLKAFSIAGTQVTLVSGAVNVRSGNELKPLQPGQQVEVNGSGHITLRPDINMEQVLGWKNGMFVFDGADIQTIMNELDRHYDIDVKYEAAINEKFVLRISRNVPLSEVLQGLAMTQLVHFKIEGRTIIVSR